jgi:Zn-dependent M16 (insulinase) family peptidase
LSARRRERLLNVKVDDIREAAQKYLIDQIRTRELAVAVLGEQKEWVDDEWKILPLGLNPQEVADPQVEKVVL